METEIQALQQRGRAGRPRIGERVMVRLSDDLLDDICREALTRDVPVTQVIRERCAARGFRTSEIQLS